MSIEPNSIVCGDALYLLRDIEQDSVDFSFFSPPFKYPSRLGGFAINLEELGRELYRVTKPGGVSVVHIADSREAMAQSLCTARMQVSWVDKIGWKQYQHGIWYRNGRPSKHHRTILFRPDHENVLIFFKGARPKHIDKSHMMVPTQGAGKKSRCVWRDRAGEIRANNDVSFSKADKCGGTIWSWQPAKNEKDKLKKKHQCPSPNGMVEDMMRCFTKPGDLVLDPLVGSGTAAAMATRWSRNYIGIDINPDYCKVAEEMIARECSRLHALKQRKMAESLVTLDRVKIPTKRNDQASTW